MKFYYAPLEGVVGHVYRNAHRAHFNHIDKYFAPFIVADQTKGFRSKDLEDILPENNKTLTLVPQILSNNASDFNHTAKKISAYGYDEISLNLGCPSKMVVSKNRGSGFLAFRDELNRFLEGIYSNPVVAISIKTRLGKYKHEEFYDLIEIFNQYPIKELTIHPRVQTDIYRNKPNLEVFKDALELSKNPVCYNGDIFTLGDFIGIRETFPEVETFMLGRGLLVNPGLVGAIKEGVQLDKESMRGFLEDLYRGYQEDLIEPHKVLSKMKESWNYLIQAFSNHEDYYKELKRAGDFNAYEAAVERLFNEQSILQNFGYKTFKTN